MGSLAYRIMAFPDGNGIAEHTPHVLISLLVCPLLKPVAPLPVADLLFRFMGLVYKKLGAARRMDCRPFMVLIIKDPVFLRKPVCKVRVQKGHDIDLRTDT